MRKKLIVIAAIVLAAVLAVVIIFAVNNKQEIEPAGKDMDVSAGVEESEFDDDWDPASDYQEDSSDSKDSSKKSDNNKSNFDKNSSSGSSSQNSTSSNKSESNNDKENNSGSDQSSSIKPSKDMDYESFHAMSPAEQQAYMESFDSTEKFFKWYNKEKEKYEKEHPDIEVGDGPVELE